MDDQASSETLQASSEPLRYRGALQVLQPLLEETRILSAAEELGILQNLSKKRQDLVLSLALTITLSLALTITLYDL